MRSVLSDETPWNMSFRWGAVSKQAGSMQGRQAIIIPLISRVIVVLPGYFHSATVDNEQGVLCVR